MATWKYGNAFTAPPGSKIADFQLAYAVKVLTGRLPAGRKLAAAH